jgi:hypothetical protein
MKTRLLILAVLITTIVSAQKKLGSGFNPDTLGVANPAIVTSYYGTMTANTTYIVIGNIDVPNGDTLTIPSGVTLCMENGACITVQGVLISLGTQANPNWFTVCGRPKTDNIGQAEATDSAWNGGVEQGLWTGIECDTSCRLLVLKWTHVEFVGAGANNTSVAAYCDGVAVGATKTNYGVFFQNVNGNFILEDSWIYGSLDDAIHVQEGHFDIMRNTFEKTGYTGGDCNNMKSGAVGDCAYNLYMGCATNGTKASNKDAEPIEDDYNMYNNTYVNCGYRQTTAQKGACIDYEQGAKGSAYNNLIVDCKFGFRVVGSPIADTTNLFYSNNFIYGDSVNVTGQFYPNQGYITRTDAYISPIPAETGYVYNPNGSAAYNSADATTLCGENNPMFVNFPLPENPTNFPGMNSFLDINNDNCMHNFSFHLQSGSPVVGVGYTNSSFMLNACAAVSIPSLGFTPNESAPCADLGCYPYTNSAIGNQHNCSTSLGVEPIAEDNGVKIYPNPNHGSFIIQSSVVSGQSSVAIYNILGELVYSQLSIVNYPLSINLSNQPSGVYLYRVIKQDGSLLGSGKLIIE